MTAFLYYFITFDNSELVKVTLCMCLYVRSCCQDVLKYNHHADYHHRLVANPYRCKCTHCATMISVSLSVSHSLPLSPSVSMSLSDKLGDSLFCRKCSHHTDSRLVYSRFNLIIASPPFNQRASACFMLKPHYKYRINFDKPRRARLSQKSSAETEEETEIEEATEHQFLF